MQTRDTPEMRQARAALGAKLWRLPERGFPEPLGDKWPTLATMQETVGGYIELVPCGYEGVPSHLIVNEDARTLALPPNELASACAGRPILGEALLWVGPLPPDA